MSALSAEANNPGHAAAAPRPQLHDAVWPPKVPRTVDVPETSLWFNLEVSARRYPDKTAYHFFGRRITYLELKTLAESLAGWLQQRAGVQHGDRVLVMFEGCIRGELAGSEVTYDNLVSSAMLVGVDQATDAGSEKATGAGNEQER